MNDIIAARLKTAIESTESLDDVLGCSTDTLCNLVDLSISVYGKSNPEIVVDGNNIPYEQLLVGACINVSLFSHFAYIGANSALDNLDVYAHDIMQMYILLLEFEAEMNNSEWWDDANQYGLTSYQEAEEFYSAGVA